VTPEDEDVRMMQREISDVLLAHGRRIRCGNDLATVRKALGEVQTDVAEFLRASGAPGRPSGILPAEAGTTATPGASMSVAARAKMLAADDIAQGRVVGSRGAPGFLVRGATERRRARELEQDEAKAQQRAGWIKTADRLPTAADHPGGAVRRDSWGRVVPIDHVPCLVVTPDHPDEVALLLWNLHHLCWDDTSGDDFRCAAEYVSHWMPAPAVPAVEVPDGK
jgi:hypothetical protein